MDAIMSRNKRKGRLLLIAPLVVVPLVTIYVWVLSAGGRIDVARQTAASGFNMNLPGVHLKEEKGLDKMAYYKKAEEDSLRQEKKRQGGKMGLPGVDSADGRSAGQGPDVERIQRKLGELKGLMNRDGSGMAGSATVVGERSGSTFKREPAVASAEIERLERMMKMMKDGQAAPDPEMRELNRTLDKLMAVQHPETVPDSSRRKPEGALTLPVSPALGGDVINSLKTSSPPGNRFYDLETSGGEEEPESGAMIEAVVPETQTLISGDKLRLELRTDLVIKGDRIPRGAVLFGETKLSNDRLFVKVSAINYRGKVYHVALQVVDQDGLAGIYEQGSTIRDAASESTSQGVGSLGPGSLDPSFGGQVASAGIQLARSLASRKIRKAPVTVTTNYSVFLEDISQKH
jgi:conjugative transposon TraM protein